MQNANEKKGRSNFSGAPGKMKVDTEKVPTFIFCCRIKEQKGSETMSKKGVPHRHWSKEEKLKIVMLHLEEHISVEQIGKEQGVSPSLVSAWVKKYLEEGEEALEPHNGNPYAALHTSKSLSEVDRLRLIVAKQEVEIARLKKGYWVEGAGANKEYVTGSGKTTKSSKNSE